MNVIAKNWSCLLVRILITMLVLMLILISVEMPLTEAKGSNENDLKRHGSRIADVHVNEGGERESPSALLNSQSLFDFSNIKRSTYSVSGSRLEIGIEWTEGHDFDIWCGQENSYERDCENHEFQVDLGNGIIIDEIISIDMWEEYLTVHVEVGEYVVKCNQVINVSYQPSGRSSMGDPPDVPFSIEVSQVLDWLDQYDLQIKIQQDYLSYVEFMDDLKGLNLLEWYLTYINDLRVSEDGQHQLEFRIKPKLECFPSQVEHSLDLKIYTTDQNSLKLTPDQLKFAESNSDSLTLTFTNENSSDYQQFTISAVDDEWAEKSSLAFMYLIVESENKNIENIGDLGGVTPFLVSTLFLVDNDEVIQVQPSSTTIKSKDLQKLTLSLKAPLNKVSDTYVLVTLHGNKGRLLDPSYDENSNSNGNVEGFVRDYILYKISDDTWTEEYPFFVQAVDEGNADLHFLTFNDEFLDTIASSFDSLFANNQKYLSGQFPKLTEFNFNSPINCSVNQDCVFSLLPHILLFDLVNEWVNSFMDLDDFLTVNRQGDSQFNTFISHYPFPKEFNFFQLLDNIGGIENTLINYMQFKIRDSSDPYLGVKHTENIQLRKSNNGTGGGGGWIPSSNADLADLAVYIGKDNILEQFSADDQTYHVETEADSIEIVFETVHIGASIFVNDEQVEERMRIDLEDGKNIIEIVVRAENGKEKIYTLTFIKTLLKNPFSDIDNHWAYDNIIEAYKLGIFNGYKDGTFKPELKLERLHTAMIFANLLNIQSETGVPFSDTRGYEAETIAQLAAMHNAGLIYGYQDGTFGPRQPITRAQFALIFARVYEHIVGSRYEPNEIAPFSDINKYDVTTQKAITLLYDFNIAEGSNGNYMPTNSTTRAQAAKMLVLMKQMVDELYKSE